MSSKVSAKECILLYRQIEQLVMGAQEPTAYVALLTALTLTVRDSRFHQRRDLDELAMQLVEAVLKGRTPTRNPPQTVS